MIERIRVAIVDTGPLMSALILDYASQESPARSESILQKSRFSEHFGGYLGDKTRQVNFMRLFDGIERILTTSHVVAELQGLQKLTGDYRREFWESAVKWLQRKKVDEQLVRLLDLHANQELRALIYDIGPPDTGLLDLAMREGFVLGNREGKALLTDDARTLAQRARSLKIRVEVVEHLLNQY